MILSSILNEASKIPCPESFKTYEDQSDHYGFSKNTFVRWEPFFRFLYEDYFHVETIGIENIPKDGSAILYGNHSGGLPVDAFMLYVALYNKHPAPRRIRFLVDDCLLITPGINKIICGCGGVPASYKVARELLNNNELTFFYPEGVRGTGKLFSMRYRLNRFAPGFIKAAIETGSPIIPIATIGCDEIYPILWNIKPLARLMGTPYWPVTPTFPLLPFPVSCLPLPVKILIKVGKPIYLNYPPEKAKDKKLILKLAKDFQYQIQAELNYFLSKRKSPFSNWNLDELRSDDIH